MQFAYYKILKIISSLETTVLNSNDQTCAQIATNANEKISAKTETSVAELLAEDNKKLTTKKKK